MKKALKIISVIILLCVQYIAECQIRPFVTTWTTSADLETISIPLNGSFSYDFTYVWKNAADTSEVTSGVHTSSDGAFATQLADSGSYLLEITGDFPNLQRGYPVAQLTDVNQWGDIVWESFNETFRSWPGSTFSATDRPNLTNVTTTRRMFFDARNFNINVSDWDVSNVQNMSDMFRGATDFTSDLSGWDVSNATRIDQIFAGAQSFNSDLSGWVLNENVTSLSGMFRDARNFNSDLNNWDVSNVTNMSEMFRQARDFNSDLNNWNVSNVTNMQQMFEGARAFNGDISTWNTTSVTNMNSMFRFTNVFNGDISDWNVGNVTGMGSMFQGAVLFNRDISGWNVSKVTNTGVMFAEARAFNQDISGWDMRNKSNLSRMFRSADAFNQNISAWDVSSVTNMFEMFLNADVIDQDFGAWDISSVSNMQNMFNGSGLSPQNYDQTLIGWAAKVDDTTPDVNLGASGLTFCLAETARQSLIDNGWTVNDADTQVCSAETDVVTFKILDDQLGDEVIDEVNHTVTLSILSSADITSLTPVVELSPGAIAVPDPTTIQDFTSPVVFTITAEDEVATQDWTVTVTQEIVALTDTDILTFVLAEDSPGLDQVTNIALDDVAHTVTLDLVPFGSLTTIIPEITLSQGATSNLPSGESIDLSTGSGTLTVTAEDGTTTQDWTVNTNVSPSEETDVTAFEVPNQIGTSDIDPVNHAISFIYPSSLDETAITPVITLSGGATVDPSSETAQDFTDTVRYTVTAQDAATTQEWAVNLVSASSEADILSFRIPFGTPGVEQVSDVQIDTASNAITINVKPFESLTTIFPEIVVSEGAIISPASGEEIDVSSGSVTYTVTAEDGVVTRDWTVSTNVLPSEETDFISFEFPELGVGSVINTIDHTILVNFSEGTDLTALTPTIEVSPGATAVPGSGEVQDFSSDVIYTVTAQDGATSQEWTVSTLIRRPFITSWSTSADSETISIPLNGDFVYAFTYAWKHATDSSVVTFGSHTSADGAFATELPTAGDYLLEIIGDFPHFQGYPKASLTDVNQWGDIIWSSMFQTFNDWPGTAFSAEDNPDLSQVTNMGQMFFRAGSFNDDISDWDVSNVTNMSVLFRQATAFNQPLDSWNMSNVTNTAIMFENADSFNQDLTGWNTISVSNMLRMFNGADNFNGDINTWNVSNVTNMQEAFRNADSFNQDLIDWNTGSVSNMNNMFRDTDNFNGDISNWNVANVTSINATFRNADSFNQNLTSWNTGSVTSMNNTFRDTDNFNGDISNWNVSNATNMQETFRDANAFDQDLSGWDISGVTNMNNMFNNSGLSPQNYDQILTGWATKVDDTTPDVTLGANVLTFCKAEAARQSLIGNGWTINDSGIFCLDETDITAFTIDGVQLGDEIINTVEHTILFVVSPGADVTNLTPVISLSPGANVDPVSNIAQDFSSPVVYTVTAEDGVTTQEWTVTFTDEVAEILDFSLADDSPGLDQISSIELDSENSAITLNLIPFGSLSTIIPEVIITPGATISPLSSESIDLSTGSFTYTVTAEDGTTAQDWVVSTNVLISEETDFISFALPGQANSSTINTDEHTILVNFAEGVDRTALTPVFEVSQGASVTPASGEAQDFSADVIYTVTAQDEVTTQEWTVSTQVQRPFITSWTSSGGNLSIGLNEDLAYDFNYVWKNGSSQIVSFGQHSSAEGDFVTNLPTGEFTLEILGNYPHFTSYPKSQLMDVNQWGDIVWQSFRESFRNWTGTDFSATDAPNLSQVTDMASLFEEALSFNGDLSQWDVSNVTSFERAFRETDSFTGNSISGWNTGNAINMNRMFAGANIFNGDISSWNVENVIDMNRMFNLALAFNGDCSGWDVGNVTDMFRMFRSTSFDQDISNWKISNVTDMGEIFNGSALSTQFYDRILNAWSAQAVQPNVTLGATGIGHCFGATAVATLETNNGWTINDAGQLCSSENDILTYDIPDFQVGESLIDTAAHTVSATVLNSTALTSLIPEITVSTAASIAPNSGETQNFSIPVIYTVLSSDSTAQDWTVTVSNAAVASTATDILAFNANSAEVEETTIDSVNHLITLRLIPGGSINTVTPDLTLSQGASVAPEIGEAIDLNTGSATYTVTAEDGVTTQDWSISVILNDNTDILDFELTGVFANAQIDDENHTVDIVVVDGTDLSALLTEIVVTEGASIAPQAVTVQDFTSPVTYTVTAADGTTTREWTVSLETTRPFITTWSSNDDNEQFITLEVDEDFEYNFGYQWLDENGEFVESGSHTSLNGDFDSELPSEGTFTLEIIGDFPHFLTFEIEDLIDVSQWGDIAWGSFESTFRDWLGVEFSATDTPDLSQVESMRTMFRLATSFNGDLSNWDVSNVVDIAGIFNEASSFAGDVSQWQVDNVTDMQGAFNGTAFNGDLSNWNVSNVTNMINMFLNASLFNQDLSSWNIGQVTDMSGMLSGTAMSVQNYDKFLISISTQTVQPNVTLGALGIGHCFGASAVETLEIDNGWTINDEGPVCSSENDMLTFDIPDVQLADEIIDAVAHTVDVTVLNSATLSALSPVITLSSGATFATASPKSGEVVDFTNPVAYEVLSSDSTFQTWTVTVDNSATPFTETDILTFVPDVGSNVNIDSATHEITFDAVITSEFLVTPEFTLSTGATSSPISGEEIDLTDGTEIYSVTAEDGTTLQDWIVAVNDLRPANDLCSNAITVNVNDIVIGNTTLATSDESIAPDCGSNNTGIGVWYRLVGTGETITLNTCSPNSFSDTSLSLFTGSCSEGLICVAGNEDAGILGECGGSGFQARLGFNSEAGVEYLVLVDGFSGSIGEFELTITSAPTPELPANDDCETAETLTVFAEGEGTPVNGNNTNAALFSGQVDCDNFGAVNDVWYTFNSGSNVRVGITLTGIDADDDGPLNAARDFRLAAYEECGGNSILCDTNADGFTNLNVTPDTEYRLQVWNDDVEDEGTFTIIVNDGANTAANLSFENAQANQITISRFAENATLVDQLDADDPEGDEQSFSIISGNGEGIFAIDPVTGEITIANTAALQASATTVFDLTFQAADQSPGELTSTITLTVTISENGAPVIGNTSFDVAENTTNGTTIGNLDISDPNGDDVTITGFISSPPGALSLNLTTGDVLVGDQSFLDFETGVNFQLNVDVQETTSGRLTTSETVEITLTDVNEAPVVSDASFTISQFNANGSEVGTVTFTEVDADQTHSFTINEGNGELIFTIEPSTGVITVVDESALNSNGITTYNLTVEVSDNGTPILSGSGAVAIEVVGNNPPVISTDALSVNENSTGGTLVGSIEATDADDDQVTLSLVNNLNRFLLTQDGQLFVRNGAVLNFEDTPQIDLEVAATDNGPGALQTVKTIAIQLNNVNEPLRLFNASFDISTVFENGALIGTMEVEDLDSEAFTFSILTGNEEGIFAINETSGELSLADRDLLNPILTPRYTLTVSVSDGEFTDEAQVTIDVFANPDVPVFTSANTFSIDENNELDALIGTVIATDGDGISDYDIVSGDDEGLFEIDETTGELRADFEVVFNFEETQQYILEVRAEDDGIGNLSSTQQITININDVNEFDPVVTEVSGTIAENSDSGSAVATVEASDDDIFQTLSYEITAGNDAGLFAIDGNGEITTTAAIDFEADDSFNLTVVVSDDVAPVRTTSQEVIISVTDVNETPVIEAIANQNGSVGSEISFTVTANDPENDELTFSFADDTQVEGMEINSETGVFIWTPATDQLGSFETTINVTDGEFTASETISFTILNSETDILTFALNEQTSDAVINTTDHTIGIEVTRGSDVTALIPTITISEEASISPASGVATDYTNAVIYTVTAQDGTTQEWTVTVTEAPNTETDILTFALSEQTGAANINATDHTVVIEVAFGTDVTALESTFTLSEGATSNPAGGTALDFTDPVTITITAEDGSTIQEWIATVTIDSEEPDIDTDILTFVLVEETGAALINTEAHTVNIEVAFGTNVVALTPTITLSEGATSDPASGALVDFTNPVTYTVTAEDDAITQNWTVTVTVVEEALSTETDILSFILDEQTGPAVINTINHTVAIEVTFGTDLTALTPVITLSEGATINPESGAIVDLTSPATYSITAEDGSTIQEWEITVTEDGEFPDTDTDILTFVLEEQVGVATINTADHTVAIEVTFGTDVTSLSPTLTLSEGASSNPASEVAVDFTNSVTYSVTAEDATTIQDWVVTVTVEEEVLSNETDILSFILASQTGSATINATTHTVTIDVAFGTDVTALIPTFTLSDGATSNPASGEAVDFTNAVNYSVTAEDATTIQDWVVTVTIEEEVLSDETDILSFILTSQTGSATINTTTHTVTIEVAFGTDVTALIPTFTLSDGANSDPESGEPVNFTNPIAYLITAEDGVTIQAWVITVSEEDKPLGVEEEIDLRVYPNPVQDILYVKTQEEVQITLTDLMGHSVISKQNGDQFELNLIHLKSGVYFLIIQYSDQIVSRKIYKRD